MGLIIIFAALAAFIVVVWIIGAREPVYAIARGEPAWFVAIRGNDQALTLSPDVTLTWSGRADFAFIGADAYWSRFYILSGGDGARSPVDLTHAEDAYVARVQLAAPPKLALGIIKLLVVTGFLAKPHGALSNDLQAKGYRVDLIPDQSAVARLLNQPSGYAPSMVNFLSYYSSARYADGRAGSGRAAYARYGMVALRTVYRTGGHLLFYGRVTEILREASNGPTTGAWSDVAAMHYPNPSAILSMEHIATYRAALHLRDAGLERTVVIASTDERLTS